MLTIKIIKSAPGVAQFPTSATSGSAGMDLYAAIDQPVDIPPQERRVVGTGMAIALPVGVEAQIRSRSGLASKHGVVVFNAPGTIDSDYRGEIKVILANFGKEVFTVVPGMRIAQMVVARYEQVLWDLVSDLPDTSRGAEGFGSSGGF
jgi:dUTP pyrophosphatase